MHSSTPVAAYTVPDTRAVPTKASGNDGWTRKIGGLPIPNDGLPDGGAGKMRHDHADRSR